MSSAERNRRLPFRLLVLGGMLSVMTVLGLVGTAAVSIDWFQGLETYRWDEAPCTIVSSRVVAEGRDDGRHRLEVEYRYRYRGESYEGDAYRHDGSSFDEIANAQREAARFEAGSERTCWVDPEEPARAFLRRANLWRGLWVFVPLIFVAIGVGSLAFLFGPWRGLRTGGETGSGAVEKLLPFRALMLPVGLFGAFLLFGLGILIPFFLRPALQVLEARSWRPVSCEVLSSSVRTHSGDDGATYSVEVLYRYEVDGREHLSERYRFLGGSSGGYEAKAEAVAGIPAGTETTCWVDPDDPFDAVLERGLSSDYLFGLIPLLFALVGLGGITFTLVGIRRMKADAGRPSWPPGPGDTGGRGHRDEEPSDSSGPLLVEPRTGPLGKLGTTIIIAVLWNGVLSLFLWQIVESWRAGNREWLLSLFLVPFVLIGLLLIASIPYGILALANPRARLRLSTGAVRAGRNAEVVWSFRGSAGRIDRLRIWLESSRTTTATEVHDRGVSVRRRTEPLDTIEIVDRGPDTPLALGSATFHVPVDAPPTSTGDEGISWKLKLQGSIDYWPDVIEEYPIRVLPPDPRQASTASRRRAGHRSSSR